MREGCRLSCIAFFCQTQAGLPASGVFGCEPLMAATFSFSDDFTAKNTIYEKLAYGLRRHC